MDCVTKLVTSRQNFSSVKTNKYQLGNHYVKVFYRISSLCKIDQEHVKISDSTMFIRRQEQLKDVTKQSMPPSYWEFITDGIFYKVQQKEVYNEVVEDIVNRLAEGNNGILVGFGQTGSGKSTTIAGLEFVSNENFGIAPRVVKQLLEIKKQFIGDNRMTIEMSYIEMSKNAVYDLFKQYPNNVNAWHVDKESTKFIINTESQALKELYLGEARKETKETKNYLSHINTSVLTFYVTIEDLSFNNVNQVKSRLHLIDMAGSDTVGNLTCVFKTKGEVGSANLAKTSLEQFFLCLVEKSQKAIKSRLRTNPLIFFLKDDLNVSSALRFIGHINTDKEDLQVSLSMMRFGQIIKGYKPSSIQIEHPAKMTPENKIRYLQRKLQELEEERIQNSMLLNVDLTSNVNSERAEHLQKIVKDYLNNHISELDIIRVVDASMVFKMFKDLYTQWEQERQKLYKEASLSFGKRISDSEISLQKKKWSSRSSSTMATTKVGKEKRRIKKSKDASVDEKLSTVEKVDKQISVQSFFDSRVKPSTLKIITSQDISSGSISQSAKRRKSKFTTSIQRRASEVKQRSVSSFTDGIISDTVVTPDIIPNQIEAWNGFLKDPKYTSFMEEYKSNEKNISSIYEQYIEALKLLNEQKVNIDAIKQEIIETKMIMKFKSTDSDKYTEAIFMEAEAKCKEKKDNAEKDHIHQKEIVFRYLSELKIYLDRRRDLKEELTRNFDTFCKEKFNLPMPTVKCSSPTELIKGSAASIQLNEFHVDETIPEKLIETIEISEIQIGQFKKIMQKERSKVIKMRALDNKKIYDKKCYP